MSIFGCLSRAWLISVPGTIRIPGCVIRPLSTEPIPRTCRTSLGNFSIVNEFSVAQAEMLHPAAAPAFINTAYVQNSTLPTVDSDYRVYRASKFNLRLPRKSACAVRC
jgi:hypothetical protein